MNRQELEAKLAELESDLKLWNAALSRKLEDSVRKTTLAFIQKGEALRTQYIEALADQPNPSLKGPARAIEVERRAIEFQTVQGEIEVTHKDGKTFWAKVKFGEKEGKYSEEYIKTRIATKLTEICDTDHFKERRLVDLYDSKGFQSFCTWVEAIRLIKIEKCKIFEITFEEIEISDVIKRPVRSNSPKAALFTMAVSHVLWKLKQQQTA